MALVVYLFLKEVRHTRSLVLRDGLQELVGRIEVATHHRRLVFQDGEQQLIGDDVVVLVARIDPVVLRHVTELYTQRKG